MLDSGKFVTQIELELVLHSMDTARLILKTKHWYYLL